MTRQQKVPSRYVPAVQPAGVDAGAPIRFGFDRGSRPPKPKFELSGGLSVTISLIIQGNSSGYRMGAVNSLGERWSSERDFEPTARAQGAQPSTKNGRIPGLFRADKPAERVSAKAMLAARRCRQTLSLWYFKNLKQHLFIRIFVEPSILRYRRAGVCWCPALQSAIGKCVRLGYKP
jgi:hypothetical protein